MGTLNLIVQVKQAATSGHKHLGGLVQLQPHHQTQQRW
jgi:hypothetical protein